MDKVSRITVKEVEYTAFSLAKELMLYDEPIPDKNGKWLQISNDELYTFAKRVAESKHQERQAITTEVQKILKKYIINWESE